MWGWSWFKAVSGWKTGCTSDQKAPYCGFSRIFLSFLHSHDVWCHNTQTWKRKKKKRLVVFLCAFLRTNKPIYTLIPSCPLPPISGYIFCYVRRRLLNKPSRWKCSSSGNHGRGCTTAWQEERDDQQKNKYRRWRAARFSCLNQQREDQGTSLWLGVCVCVSIFMPMSEWWGALCNHCRTGLASCVAFFHWVSVTVVEMLSSVSDVFPDRCG